MAGEPASGDPVRVRIVALNVFYANGDYKRVGDFLRRERPDAVVLSEMNQDWRRALSPVEKDYPHRYQTLGPSGRGVTFWSRHPLKDAGVLPIGVRAEPAIQATLQLQGRELRVFSVHTTWPLAPASARRRNLQLTRLAEQAHAVTLPLVVMGDMNISSFSPHFERLLADGRLRSAAEGFGWQPTWPTFMPPAGIQIDHALVNSRVAVEHFSRGPSLGSDHLPIVADLVL